MRVTQIHAFLHLRTGYPIVPWVTLPRGDGGYVVRLLPWLRFPPTMSYQEYWLWVYKHWRYKPSLSVRKYPFYANQSEQFDLEIESQENPEKARFLGEQIREHARWHRDQD